MAPKNRKINLDDLTKRTQAASMVSEAQASNMSISDMVKKSAEEAVVLKKELSVCYSVSNETSTELNGLKEKYDFSAISTKPTEPSANESSCEVYVVKYDACRTVGDALYKKTIINWDSYISKSPLHGHHDYSDAALEYIAYGLDNYWEPLTTLEKVGVAFTAGATVVATAWWLTPAAVAAGTGIAVEAAANDIVEVVAPIAQNPYAVGSTLRDALIELRAITPIRGVITKAQLADLPSALIEDSAKVVQHLADYVHDASTFINHIEANDAFSHLADVIHHYQQH